MLIILLSFKRFGMCINKNGNKQVLLSNLITRKEDVICIAISATSMSIPKPQAISSAKTIAVLAFVS